LGRFYFQTKKGEVMRHKLTIKGSAKHEGKHKGGKRRGKGRRRKGGRK